MWAHGVMAIGLRALSLATGMDVMHFGHVADSRLACHLGLDGLQTAALLLRELGKIQHLN